MALINISGLTFAYEGSYDNIFEDVSFQIDTNWKLGFIGRNGRGKTTFLSLLMKKHEFQGTISSDMEFDYFPFNVQDKLKNTIDVVNDIIINYQVWELERELSLLDVSSDVLYRPFETLSNGEQTKVMLAALFLKESSFLLIDEPTNHLDIRAREIVSDYLKYKKGFILVSHDRAFLDNCVDHILSINKNNIEIQRGNFSSWWTNKQLNDNYELAENEKLAREIKKLAAAAKRTSEWSKKAEKAKFDTKNSGIKPDRGYVGHKAAKMMKRSLSINDRRETALEEKSKLLKNIESAESLKISSLSFHSNRLINIEDLSVYYDDKAVCSNIYLSIDQGDRVSLCGKNGSGKSSILKLICGEDIKFTGTLQRPNNLIISYVSQDTSFLKGSLSDFADNCNIDESQFKTILRKLDFSRAQFEKNMEDFSGGQKKKVLLAKSLCEKAHLYIWDEPLNFVDVLSRMQIEELILSFCPTLLFVEHDKAFCDKIANKTIML